MQERINERVDVISVYQRLSGKIIPARIRWSGRDFTITKVGFHHTVHEGRTLFHIFSVTDGTTFFKLRLNTENLHWTLEEVNDGLAN